MKKIISIMLAVIMVVSVGVIVANAGGYYDNTNGGSTQSIVTFRQPSTYCVFIPDMIDLGYDCYMTSTDMNIAEDECLVVLLNNTDSDNRLLFTSYDGQNTLKKTVHTNLEPGYEISDINPPDGCIGYFRQNDNSSIISFGLDEGYYDFQSQNGWNVPPAGTYTSQAEFNIALTSR